MKITAVTMLAVLSGAAAEAGKPGQPAERTVIVCMESDAIGAAVAVPAKEIASKMFAAIGVTLDWRHNCPAQGILISLSEHDQAERRLPQAFGYALPYEGTHIVIFYDRLQRSADPALIPSLLAHVMVHEITHILEGIARHSSQGVMKAAWDGSDYSAMPLTPLPFAPEDIDLIHRGLAERAAQAASTPAAGNTKNRHASNAITR